MTRSLIRSAALTLAVASIAMVGTAAAATHEPEVAAIVNGTEVSQAQFDAQWPFIVGVVDATADNQYDGQFCAGSLIDDQHVLTAAHCVVLSEGSGFSPPVFSAPTSVRIVAKTRTLSEAGRGSGETGLRVVSDVFVHPDFAENAGEGYRNDVAVLRLAIPIAGASTIQLVQPGEESLWGNGAGGVDAFVAGWGDTDPLDQGDGASRFPTVLRHATVPIRSDATCASTVGGGYGTAFERATNLCAGTLRSGPGSLGIDSCQGDSGGPLTVAAGDGSYRLAGITSWGEGCGDANFGAYARVDALRSWIQSVPGATDGGPGTGGPGGTMPVEGLRTASRTFTSVTLAWDAPASGTTPERYSIWRRSVDDGDRIETLLGITTRTSFRVNGAATRRATRATFVVRPLDTGGSNGVGRLLQAGPIPDVTAPGLVRVAIVSRGRTAAVIRWSAARDLQSGVARYQVQRRLVDRRGGWGNAPVRMNGTSARLSSLPSGERIQVRVRAYDRAGNAGGWSAVRTFRTAA